MAIVFNPSFPYRIIHMVIAAYLTTAFVALGVGAWYRINERFPERAKTMMTMALGMILLAAPLQIFVGDLHGLNVLEYQPAKIAAMEGHWETKKGAPLILFGLPDQEAEKNHFEIGIPKLSSLILKHDLDGELKGLKEWPKADRPPVFIVFWAFRIMTGIGALMLLTGVLGAYLYVRGQLYDTLWYLWLCRLTSPLGFVAILAGWVVAEVGRQPYVVYGVMRTADAASPVSAGAIGFSMLLYGTAYSLLFFAGALYIQRILTKGPAQIMEEDELLPDTPAHQHEERVHDHV